MQSISVNEITHRADVNRSTFYAHFTDKYDLFQACVRVVFEEALLAKLPAARDMQCETIRTLIAVTCEFFGQLTRGCTPRHRQLDPIVETEVQRVIYEYLLAWLQSDREDTLEVQDSIEMRAMVMSWAIFGAGIEYRHRAQGRTPEEFAAAVYTLLLDRVLPEAGGTEPVFP